MSEVVRYVLQDVPAPSDGVMKRETVMLGYVASAPGTGDEPFFFLGMDYVGARYRFMDGEVVFSLDGTRYETIDRSPTRTSRGAGAVYERVWAPLPEGSREALLEADSMRVQFWEEPFAVSERDLRNMQAFMKAAAEDESEE